MRREKRECTANVIRRTFDVRSFLNLFLELWKSWLCQISRTNPFYFFINFSQFLEEDGYTWSLSSQTDFSSSRWLWDFLKVLPALKGFAVSETWFYTNRGAQHQQHTRHTTIFRQGRLSSTCRRSVHQKPFVTALQKWNCETRIVSGKGFLFFLGTRWCCNTVMTPVSGMNGTLRRCPPSDWI